MHGAWPCASSAADDDFRFLAPPTGTLYPSVDFVAAVTGCITFADSARVEPFGHHLLLPGLLLAVNLQARNCYVQHSGAGDLLSRQASRPRHGMHQHRRTQMCVRPTLDYMLLLRYSYPTWTWYSQMAAQCHLLDALTGSFKATNHVNEQA